MGEPCTFKEGVQSELTEEQWEELLQPGAELHGKWKIQIDLITGYLLELKNAGIAILRRPYHEMNGGWFWWGDEYVDIVGCDVYHFGKEKPYYKKDNYDMIHAVAPGKLLGIVECSEIPSEAVLEEQPL